MNELTSSMTSNVIFMVVSIAFLLLLSAFFSGSETALTAASRAKLRTRADKGDPGAKKALKIYVCFDVFWCLRKHRGILG